MLTTYPPSPPSHPPPPPPPSLSPSAPAISIQNSTVPPEDFLPVTMTSNSSLLFPPPPPYRPGSPALSDRSTPYSSPAASPVPSPSASPLHSPFYSPCPSPTPPIHRSNPSGMCVNDIANNFQLRINDSTPTPFSYGRHLN